MNNESEAAVKAAYEAARAAARAGAAADRDAAAARVDALEVQATDEDAAAARVALEKAEKAVAATDEDAAAARVALEKAEKAVAVAEAAYAAAYKNWCVAVAAAEGAIVEKEYAMPVVWSHGTTAYGALWVEPDYWEAVTNVPCPLSGCAGVVRWAEEGAVPGWRRCDKCGTQFQTAGTARAPILATRQGPPVRRTRGG